MSGSKLSVAITSGDSYCECCGGYEWWTANVVLPDGERKHYHGDSHLGGNWDSKDVYKMILEDMVDKLEVTEEWGDD